MTNFERITKNPKQLAEFLARSHRELLANVIDNGGNVPEEEYDAEKSETWINWLKEEEL